MEEEEEEEEEQRKGGFWEKRGCRENVCPPRMRLIILCWGRKWKKKGVCK